MFSLKNVRKQWKRSITSSQRAWWCHHKSDPKIFVHQVTKIINWALSGEHWQKLATRGQNAPWNSGPLVQNTTFQESTLLYSAYTCVMFSVFRYVWHRILAAYLQLNLLFFCYSLHLRFKPRCAPPKQALTNWRMMSARKWTCWEPAAATCSHTF